MNYLLKKSVIACFVMSIFAITSVNAQVTIGSGVAPNKAALLDIKEVEAAVAGGVTSTIGGLLLPRVELVNNKELTPFIDTTDPDYEIVQKPKHKGLFLYYVGNDELAAGVYIWSGSEWMQFGTRSAVKPIITSLQCNNASINPSLISNGTPYDGVMKIPYTGGNGGAYSGGEIIQAKAPNARMFAKLQPGVLEYGTGDLIFTLYGTPDSDSPVEFDIEFLGFTCTATVSGDVLGVGQSIAYSEYLPDFIPEYHGKYMSDITGDVLLHPMIDNLRLDYYYTGAGATTGYCVVNTSGAEIKAHYINPGSWVPQIRDVQPGGRIDFTGATGNLVNGHLMIKINDNTFRWYEIKYSFLPVLINGNTKRRLFFQVIRIA